MMADGSLVLRTQLEGLIQDAEESVLVLDRLQVLPYSQSRVGGVAVACAGRVA